MTFQQLTYVAEIARCGSINKAAANLFVSQSNISNSIKELEEYLGLKIFERSNRGVLLTNKGKEFLGYIRPILEQKYMIETLYSNEISEPALNFSVSTQRYPFSVEAFVNFFRSKNLSRYDLIIKETDMYQVIDDIYNNKSDIGIIFISDMTEKFIQRVLKTKNIEFNFLAKIKPHIFISKNHPLADKKSVKLEELDKYPYIMFGQENGTALDFAEEVSLVEIQHLKKTIRIHDRGTIYSLLLNLDAFSIGSGIIPEGYGDPSIRTVPISDNKQMMKLGWLKLKSKPLTNDMSEFVAHLEKAIAG